MGGVIGARYLNDQSAKKFLWLVPVRDLIDCVFWCCGFLGNTIYWRGQRFRLAKGGKLVLLSAPGSRERFAEK
jgi:ceramide glucosyltransferase